MSAKEWTRRRFVGVAAGLGAGLWVPAALAEADERAMKARPKGAPAEDEKKEEEVSANEDLMREHGVLDRVLLVYEEGVRRLESKEDLSPSTMADAAGLIRRFIEDYHEKLEEDHLFPRFEKARKLAELVATLRTQHQAGHRLTEMIQGLCTAPSFKDDAARRRLADSMRAFIRMYRPHAAREDTVLFPALREVVSPNEYDALGEDFERKEHQIFGEGGFETILAQVVKLERALGIDDLGRFTPA